MPIPSNLPALQPATYSASSAVQPPTGQGDELREAIEAYFRKLATDGG